MDGQVRAGVTRYDGEPIEYNRGKRISTELHYDSATDGLRQFPALLGQQHRNFYVVFSFALSFLKDCGSPRWDLDKLQNQIQADYNSDLAVLKYFV